jgi:hypothetical protein
LQEISVIEYLPQNGKGGQITIIYKGKNNLKFWCHYVTKVGGGLNH